MSRPKKPKRKVRPPKLCATDQLIYALLLIPCVAAGFAPLLLVMLGQDWLFLRTGDVIAYNTHGWLLLMLLPGMVFFAPLIWLAIRFQARKPFVGPKLPANGPILSEAQKKKKRQKPYERRGRRMIALLLLAVYGLLCIPAVGSFFARTEVTATEVRVYTLFGIETRVTPLSEVASVKTGIHRGNRGSYHVSYKLTMQDGKSYSFTEHPLTLLELDAHVPPCPRTSERLEYFDRICDSYDLTAEEAARVRMLFRS